MPQVNVTINGKTYRMACDDGQEAHLEGLADRLNEIIGQLRQSFGEIGDQRLTVMAAITMGDDLAEAHRRIRRLESELAAVNETKTAVISRFEESEASIARAIDQAAGRLESLAQKLVSGDKRD
ncbi:MULTISPECIES: cell division protein ZapA [Kaistia]|uniref:Cell division protein ZapA n=1 Tax=Kaistia nematophila TaxID=2994654 RepID=A0A9X3E3W3_9HYPH|nr:cell division protein ZapA [Kaistia nematophila]MBN9025020.1 cell division protein ZapA [Hyphomicrobiales bacterium]MBN9059911.1 cell division protein ZapA [Hyphomicrobiales bacterium]MCX5571284.1 cell division protein ZapA [Kaistia nematophila]